MNIQSRAAGMLSRPLVALAGPRSALAIGAGVAVGRQISTTRSSRSRKRSQAHGERVVIRKTNVALQAQLAEQAEPTGPFGHAELLILDANTVHSLGTIVDAVPDHLCSSGTPDIWPRKVLYHALKRPADQRALLRVLTPVLRFVAADTTDAGQAGAVVRRYVQALRRNRVMAALPVVVETWLMTMDKTIRETPTKRQMMIVVSRTADIIQALAAFALVDSRDTTASAAMSSWPSPSASSSSYFSTSTSDSVAGSRMYAAIAEAKHEDDIGAMRRKYKGERLPPLVRAQIEMLIEALIHLGAHVDAAENASSPGVHVSHGIRRAVFHPQVLSARMREMLLNYIPHELVTAGEWHACMLLAVREGGYQAVMEFRTRKMERLQWLRRRAAARAKSGGKGKGISWDTEFPLRVEGPDLQLDAPREEETEIEDQGPAPAVLGEGDLEHASGSGQGDALLATQTIVVETSTAAGKMHAGPSSCPHSSETAQDGDHGVQPHSGGDDGFDAGSPPPNDPGTNGDHSSHTHELCKRPQSPAHGVAARQRIDKVDLDYPAPKRDAAEHDALTDPELAIIDDLIVGRASSSLPEFLQILEPYLSRSLPAIADDADSGSRPYPIAQSRITPYAWSMFTTELSRARDISGRRLLELTHQMPTHAVSPQSIAPIIDGLRSRRYLAEAWALWDEMATLHEKAWHTAAAHVDPFRPRIYVDRVLLASATYVSANLQSVDDAIRLVDSWAARPRADAGPAPSHRVQLDTRNLNILLHLCVTNHRPSIAFRLLAAARPRWGVWPDSISLKLVLDAARFSQAEQDTPAERWRLLAREFSLRHQLGLRQDEAKQWMYEQYDDAGFASGDARVLLDVPPDENGAGCRRPVNDQTHCERARDLVRQIVLTNYPHLRQLESPLAGVGLTAPLEGILRHPLGEARGPREDRVAAWLECRRRLRSAHAASGADSDAPTLPAIPEPHARYAHILPDAALFQSYITMLGLNELHEEIPVVLNWMRALGIEPNWRTMSSAMAFVSDTEGPRRWVRGWYARDWAAGELGEEEGDERVPARGEGRRGDARAAAGDAADADAATSPESGLLHRSSEGGERQSEPVRGEKDDADDDADADEAEVDSTEEGEEDEGRSSAIGYENRKFALVRDEEILRRWLQEWVKGPVPAHHHVAGFIKQTLIEKGKRKVW